MRKTITILMLFITVGLFAQIDKSWYSSDKITHLGFSYGISSTLTHFYTTNRVRYPVIKGMASAVIIGTFKEVYDKYKKIPTGFSYKDMAWNTAGAVIGAVVYYTIKIKPLKKSIIQIRPIPFGVGIAFNYKK